MDYCWSQFSLVQFFLALADYRGVLATRSLSVAYWQHLQRGRKMSRMIKIYCHMDDPQKSSRLHTKQISH